MFGLRRRREDETSRLQLANKKKQIVEDMQHTFSTGHGRRTLIHLLETFHFSRTTAGRDTEGRIDPATVQYNEGQRSVMLYIYQQTKVSLDELDEAIHKAMEEEDSEGEDYA